MKKYSYIIIGLLIFNSIQSQWINEKGKGYYKIGGWSLLADEHYTDQGIVDPNATRGLFISSFYGNMGFLKKSILLLISLFLSKNTNLLKYPKPMARFMNPDKNTTALETLIWGLNTV
ncbi:hypothetical protein N9313_04950 [Flavobacteriaceae bacterium]|nr:hypothetical protein [Flavobacteriaceae bacterium]